MRQSGPHPVKGGGWVRAVLNTTTQNRVCPSIDVMRELARHWRHPGLPGTDLLRAKYVTHSVGTHAHPGYAIGVITAGAEMFDYRGGSHVAGHGAIVAVEPDRVHTGQAADPAGWTYQMFYPEADVLAAVAAEVTAQR